MAAQVFSQTHVGGKLKTGSFSDKIFRMEQTWQTYEQVAEYLLDKFASDFDLKRVEGKQSIIGVNSGTSWEIDAKGFGKINNGFVIVECRRFTKAKQSQERLGSLAYRISDTGANGGIIVSPLGIQLGAQLIADAENIVSVTLDQNSTPTEFSMQFLNKIFVGHEEHVELTDKIEVTLIRICTKCKDGFPVQNNEQICPSCSEIIE